MMVGLIVECGKDGPDEKVCRHFIRELNPAIRVVCTSMTNKRKLVEDCGGAAAALLESGCEYVVIVWDMNPPWDDTVGTCLKAERDAVFKSIDDAGVLRADVRLVAVHMMLEAWLLADERAIKALIERDSHPLKAKAVKHPERNTDPKAALKGIFERYGGKRHTYSDMTHAIKLAQAMPDLARVRKCDSFKRFAQKAAGITL